MMMMRWIAILGSLAFSSAIGGGWAVSEDSLRESTGPGAASVPRRACTGCTAVISQTWTWGSIVQNDWSNGNGKCDPNPTPPPPCTQTSPCKSKGLKFQFRNSHGSQTAHIHIGGDTFISVGPGDTSDTITVGSSGPTADCGQNVNIYTVYDTPDPTTGTVLGTIMLGCSPCTGTP